MATIVPKYRVVIVIGNIRYIASQGNRPLPWVDWHDKKTKKRQLFLQGEAMEIADKYNDQKPTIEKCPKFKALEDA